MVELYFENHTPVQLKIGPEIIQRLSNVHALHTANPWFTISPVSATFPKALPRMILEHRAEMCSPKQKFTVCYGDYTWQSGARWCQVFDPGVHGQGICSATCVLVLPSSPPLSPLPSLSPLSLPLSLSAPSLLLPPLFPKNVSKILKSPKSSQKRSLNIEPRVSPVNNWI